MSNFCPDQGRTRVCGEAYVCTPQPETRGERRAEQKGPFMGGNSLHFDKITLPRIRYGFLGQLRFYTQIMCIVYNTFNKITAVAGV